MKKEHLSGIPTYPISRAYLNLILKYQAEYALTQKIQILIISGMISKNKERGCVCLLIFY